MQNIFSDQWGSDIQKGLKDLELKTSHLCKNPWVEVWGFFEEGYCVFMLRIKRMRLGKNSRTVLSNKTHEKEKLTVSFPVALFLKLARMLPVHWIFGINILSLPSLSGSISIHNYPSISVINLASALLPASFQSLGLIPTCAAVWDIPNVLRTRPRDTGGGMEAAWKRMGKRDCQPGPWP